MVSGLHPHHVCRHWILEHPNDFSKFYFAGSLVERPNGIAYSDLLNGRPVYRRSCRKTLILNPQSYLLQPWIILIVVRQRIHASGGDRAIRLVIVPAEFGKVQGDALLSGSIRPDDPMPHPLAGQCKAHLSDKFLSVCDGHGSAARFGNLVRKQNRLARPCGRYGHDVARSATPFSVYRGGQIRLIWS